MCKKLHLHHSSRTKKLTVFTYILKNIMYLPTILIDVISFIIWQDNSQVKDLTKF